MTHFDISHLGPTDFEGLTSNPDRGTLYVGARTTKQIFEVTHNGALVRTISASGVSGLRFASGLAMAPASNGTAQMNLWIVDRAIDNDADPNENDGRLFEISAPNIGGTPTNQPPLAVDDAASTTVDAAVTVPVLANDSDPNGDPLTVTNLTQPANGTAQRNPDNTVTYTPNTGFTGTNTFTYTANDGQANSNVATVTVTVSGAGGGDPQTVVLTFQTSPGGLKLDVNGMLETATFSRTVIVGSTITISAPSPKMKGSKSYSFTSRRMEERRHTRSLPRPRQPPTPPDSAHDRQASQRPGRNWPRPKEDGSAAGYSPLPSRAHVQPRPEARHRARSLFLARVDPQLSQRPPVDAFDAAAPPHGRPMTPSRNRRACCIEEPHILYMHMRGPR
jgi:hypothetical protein